MTKYEKNKAVVQFIRKEFLNEHPEFDYDRIYTEKRKNDRCRSKFYRAGNAELFVKWLKKHYGKSKNVSWKVKMAYYWMPFAGVYDVTIYVD